jgi:hypothetical protein
VESLNLAVGLWPLGPVVPVPGAGHGQGVVEENAPVGDGVVGEHTFHDDPVGPEPG